MPEGLYRYRCECTSSSCDREMSLLRADWERLAALGQVVHADHSKGRRVKLRILDARAVGTSWGVGGKPL